MAPEMTDIERIEEQIALAMEAGGAPDILSALRAMPLDLRLALADELVPWEPIEKAPKDGTSFIACHPAMHGWNASVFVTSCRLSYGIISFAGAVVTPTHFKPLPTPPQQKDVTSS